MNERYLEYFLDVADSLSITTSAERLYLTPQGLSKAIRSLETELGVLLLHRNGKQLMLTEAARDMMPCFEDAVAVHKDILSKAQNYKNGQIDYKNKIQVMTTPCTTRYLSPHFASMFGSEAVNNFVFREVPLLQLEKNVNALKDERWIYMMSLPELDYYKEVMRNVLESNEFAYLPLISTNIEVAVSNSSFFAAKDFVSMSEISKFPVVAYQDEVLLDFLEDYVDRRSFSYIGNDSSVIFSRVASNNAISFLLGMARLKHLPRGVVLRKLDIDLKTEIGVLTNLAEVDSPEIMDVLQRITDFFALNSRIGCFEQLTYENSILGALE